MDQKVLERITINPAINHGKPSIRNMRFSVAQVLELLAAGSTSEELLEEYPYLESDDINACLLFAAQMANTKNIVLA